MVSAVDEGWNLLGGLLFTVSICMTPLAVYGVERATGYWPSTNAGAYRDYYKYKHRVVPLVRPPHIIES
jgi:hypothetical protein